MTKPRAKGRRRIEQALRETESHLRELLNHMPSGVTVYEAVEGARDFLIRDFNKAGERMDGLDRGRMIGRRLSRVFPEAREMGLLETLRRVWRTGRAETLPASYYAGGKNPGWRENYVYRLPGGEVVAVYRDVSELIRSAELFRKAFHLSPNAMTLTTIEDGRIIDANEEFVRMTGRRRQDVIGRTTLEIGAWEEPGHRAAMADRVLRDGRVRNMEVNVRSRNGENITTLWSGDLVEIGGERCFLAAAQDITELKKAERALIQAQRLASVGQLAAGVAHEINNPLSALSGEIQWLKRKSRGARVQKSLDFMNKVSRRIADTVTHLLTFSRESPPEARHPTAVNSLVERSLSLVERRLRERRIRVRKCLGRGLPGVRVNRGQIEQVLMNVLGNSLDATPDGGRLSLSTRHDAARSVVEISVRDTGCGIAPEHLAKVFDPFFTTKPPGKGVGLGLSVSHGIVRAHDGSIELSSEEGKGAHVLIALPVAAAPSKRSGARRR